MSSVQTLTLSISIAVLGIASNSIAIHNYRNLTPGKKKDLQVNNSISISLLGISIFIAIAVVMYSYVTPTNSGRY